MRALALFFALYFTVLGCMSCSAEEVSPLPQHATIAQATHHGCPAQGTDWCSPLCQCHCCPGFSLPAAPVLAFVARPVASFATTGFAAQPAPAVPARAPVTPWQPPRA